MIFLSRQMHDDSNPHEIIPISFNMYNVLYETYYRIEMKDQYLVDMFTDKSGWNSFARSTWSKKGNNDRKSKTSDTR